MRIPGKKPGATKTKKIVRAGSLNQNVSYQLATDPVDTLAGKLKVSVVGKTSHLDHRLGRLAVGLAPRDGRQDSRPEVRPHHVGQGHLEGLTEGCPLGRPPVVSPPHSVSLVSPQQWVKWGEKRKTGVSCGLTKF